MRSGWGAAVAISAILAAGGAFAQARHPVGARNTANDDLMKLPPADRAARLARSLDTWCIGTEAFPMGVQAGGQGDGNAYWSLRCADGSTWAIQVDPSAAVTAIDCDSFKEAAAGKECFKKF